MKRRASLLSSRSWNVPLAIGFVVLGLAFSAVADARVLILRPDGTGDVPTFQAGVDQLLAAPDCTGDDTLFVAAGTYDEDVRVDIQNEGACAVHAVVIAAGMDQTRVRSFAVVTEVIDRSRLLLFDGLTVLGEIAYGNSQTWCKWARCRFAGGFTSTLAPGAGAAAPPFDGCEFRQLAVLQGYAPGERVHDCRFVAAHTRLDGTEYGLNLRACVFEGPADDVAVLGDTGGLGGLLRFEDCVFRDAAFGIFLQQEPPVSTLILTRCRFEDVTEAGVVYASTIPGQGFFSEFQISDCSFTRCGSGLRMEGVSRQSITLYRDTFTDCRSAAIEVDVSRLEASGLEVRGSGRVGAHFALVGDMQSFSLTDSRFADNAGSGLEITGPWPTDASSPPSIDHCRFERNGGDGVRSSIPANSAFNTSALNGGDGFHFAAASVPILIEANIAAGNTGAGFRIDPGVTAELRHNDAWMNQDAGYSGAFTSTDNLSVDPQFCDPLVADFHVATASPCAPTGPFGQTGALGVGCDVMAAAVDALRESRNSINTSSKTPVVVAILGHALFDAGRIDPSRVRADGAAAAPRGNGRKSTHVEDVNRDGFADLLMTFDAEALGLLDGQITVEGQMIDGAKFRGSDVVGALAGARVAGLHEPEVRGEISLVVPSPQRIGDPTLMASLQAPGKLEVFDVSGRRVIARDLEPRMGQTIRLGGTSGLRAGIYLVRLTEAGSARMRRLVLMH